MPAKNVGIGETTTVLSGDDAFVLYKQGKDKWNDWAVLHSGAMVSFSGYDFTDEETVDFGEFIFPGNVSFRNAKFGNAWVSFKNAKFGSGGVDFMGTEFGKGSSFWGTEFGKGDVSFFRAKFGEGLVSFMGAEFGKGAVNFSGAEFGKGDVTFSDVKFGEGFVVFSNAKFVDGSVYFDRAECQGNVLLRFAYLGDGIGNKEVSFNNITFDKLLDLEGVTFHMAPDFRNADIGHISMVGTTVRYRTWKTGLLFERAAGADDQYIYRELKKLAIDAKDHGKELEFFSYEQRAKFYHELNAIQYFPILLYHIFSDFGRSISRPVIGLIFIWFYAAGIFYLQRVHSTEGSVCDALWLSASNLLPFLVWSRESRKIHLEALYGKVLEVNGIVETTAYLESIFSLIFVFLVALALRNKLRL